MLKYILQLLVLLHCSLEAVEFVLFTQPKTGTHLLIPILSELTKRDVYWAPEFAKAMPPLCVAFEAAARDPGALLFALDRSPWNRETMDAVWKTTDAKNAFLHLHAPFSPVMEAYLAEKGAVTFFIKRDPRDQIVSLLNHYKYIQCNDKESELYPTDDEKLLYLIKKESRNQTLHYMEWINSPVCCSLEFESLLGDFGGVATDADALGEMRKIASALELDLPDSYLSALYKRHLGSGWSFFKGKVGVWKEYFTERHIALMKEEVGDLLIQLGYERDLNW